MGDKGGDDRIPAGGVRKGLLRVLGELQRALVNAQRGYRLVHNRAHGLVVGVERHAVQLVGGVFHGVFVYRQRVKLHVLAPRIAREVVREVGSVHYESAHAGI